MCGCLDSGHSFSPPNLLLRWLVNSLCLVHSLFVSAHDCFTFPRLPLCAWTSPLGTPPLPALHGSSPQKPLSLLSVPQPFPNPFLSVLCVHFLSSTLPYSSWFSPFIFIPLSTFLCLNIIMLRFKLKGKCLFSY